MCDIGNLKRLSTTIHIYIYIYVSMYMYMIPHYKFQLVLTPTECSSFYGANVTGWIN